MKDREVNWQAAEKISTEKVLTSIVARCFLPGGLSEAALKESFAGATGAELKGFARKESPEEVASWDVYNTEQLATV